MRYGGRGSIVRWQTCTFDDRGHALRYRHYDTAGEPRALIRYAYDKAGRQARIRFGETDGDHSNFVEHHAYDRYGDRYRSVTVSDGRRTLTPFGRDGDGRLLLEPERDFDAKGSITGIGRVTTRTDAMGIRVTGIEWTKGRVGPSWTISGTAAWKTVS